MFQYIFKRYEKKYKISKEQFISILWQIKEHTVKDKYGDVTINSLYFDTPNKLLIRNSIEKPVYKEKLRLRCYNGCTPEGNTFIEIKKKYKGVVYKRRIISSYNVALEYLTDKDDAISSSQIKCEIDYFKGYYKDLEPSMCIFYNRQAFYDKDDPNVRITFDSDILYRDYDLDLTKGVYGEKILPDDVYIMEIKTLGAMPLWLCKILDKEHIYPTPFSKYGNAYLKTLNF